jgi:hypothetical protein
MNTAAAKTLVWTAATVVGAGLVAHVAWFLAHRAEFQAPVPRESMESKLKEIREIPQRVQNVVDYNLVKRGVGRELDWSGKPPPPPPAVVEVDDQPSEKVRDPLEKYVIVRAVKVDAVDSASSDAFIKYKPDARVTLPPAVTDGTVIKRIGERLDGEILGQVKIVAILPEGVKFSFINDPQRGHELVKPQEYDLGSTFRVLADGDTLPTSESATISIPRRIDNSPLTQTMQISPNRFRIGVDDAREIDERYAEILTDEVGYRRSRDPVTRQPNGIEITSVKSGSIASRHGVQQGDVIKSINGHPVTSESEAIQFVKQNKDNYDVWEVEVWNRGQTRTITYYPPKN